MEVVLRNLRVLHPTLIFNFYLCLPINFLGIREGGVSENASYYVFTHAPDGAIEAFPLHEWYFNYTFKINYLLIAFISTGINFSQFRDINRCQQKKQNKNLVREISILTFSRLC